jgi:hypothetical protein
VSTTPEEARRIARLDWSKSLFGREPAPVVVAAPSGATVAATERPRRRALAIGLGVGAGLAAAAAIIVGVVVGVHGSGSQPDQWTVHVPAQ